MTKAENRQRIKNQALNAIRKLYDPKNKISYDHYPDSGSYAEQREDMVSDIIINMEIELK